MLSFGDTFTGYNEINMHSSNEDKTTFITNKGVYCYMIMPLGLKNVGATYQRMMNKVFVE